MSGWFAMKHGISKHPLLKGRPERMAIWVWLVDNAVYEDTPHDINGTTIIVKRGQVAISQRRLSEETGVGRQIIRTFLKRLQDERMINPDLTHGKTVVSLCNYEKYQSCGKGANPAPNPALTHDQPIKEQINNIPVGTDDKSTVSEPTEIGTVTAALWAVGKTYLAKHGVRNPGGLIGKWRKQADSDIAILEAIQSAEKAQTEDPVPYIQAILKPKKKDFRDLSHDEWLDAVL